ncbi:MAG: histidine phosphatase family protein [Oscillospiraceae bacterium]|nr:histidine phosphatase family protein [Oscillospiraceae bacterium]
MRLVFIRHGDPDYQNDCLTPLGRMQAGHTATRLQSEPIDRIYASPMGRTIETASYTARLYGLEIQPLGFMHEIDWGTVPGAETVPFGGHPWTLGFRLLTECPALAGSPKWRNHPYFRDNLCLGYYDQVAAGFDAFLERFGLFRKGMLYEAKKPCEETIALFAHGGSGAVMFAHVLGLSFPFVLATMPYGVCSVSVIDFTPQHEGLVIPRLELFNDMAHLGEVKAERLHFDK